MVRLLQRKVNRSLVAAIVLAASMLVIVLPSASQAFHFYRGPGGGCTPAEGALGGPHGESAMYVAMLHNTFNNLGPLLPVTVVSAGDAVTWRWNSEHCHSVRAVDGSFYSGFHYPAPTPSTPLVLPGLVEYPVPTLNHALLFTHTFTTPGTYQYECEHHAIIGMRGVVVVQ